MMKILLVSLSAKNIHKTLAPWCIKSYCEAQGNSSFKIEIAEHNINERSGDIIEEIYMQSPDIVGFSCYIWNIETVIKLGNVIKTLIPHCIIILGGPEVSWKRKGWEYIFADYIIEGAGEKAFYDILNSVKDNGIVLSEEIRYVSGKNPPFKDMPSPYTDEFFRSLNKGGAMPAENQLIYYESSRGCPYSCAFCLSSSTQGVEFIEAERVKDDIKKFVDNGVKCVKFVDRTFNADRRRAEEILKYIKETDTDCVFHFEISADLLDDGFIDIMRDMPKRRVQFEIGVQSVNETTLEAVGRKTDTGKVLYYAEKLSEPGNCHIHLDLIAGLPHDTVESFKNAVDMCIEAKPHMLQIGFLKVLKGSKMERIAEDLGYDYTYFPPYEVLKSNTMSLEDIMKIKRIEQICDKYYNTGMFSNTFDYAVKNIFKSPFTFFSEFAEYYKENNIYKSSLKNAYGHLMNFLTKYERRDIISHYIKLDCLTYDAKGILPDGILHDRDKTLERKIKEGFKRENRGYNNIRVENFSYDNKKRLFIYDVRDVVSMKYKVTVI